MRAARAAWLAAACVASAPAWADAPHAHGVAKLDASIDARRLTLEFSAPLEDVLGFERRPASDKDRSALEAAAGYFKSGRAFVPAASANCRMADGVVEVEERGKGHFELVARLAYDCKEPLGEVEAAVFAQYKRLKRIDVRAVTPKGQSSARLTPAKRTFGL